MRATTAVSAPVALRGRRWTSVAGAWLGIGTSPGALLVGAGLAVRYGGSLPLASIVLGLSLIAAVVWMQGLLGVQPPWGEGSNLTQVAERYFTAPMQKILGVLIAVGMTGWYGVNVGLGGAALSALLPPLPQWAAALVLGVPVLLLSLRSLESWNKLAAVTTGCVLILVALVIVRYAAGPLPVALRAASPLQTAADMAVLLGYVGVFSVRAPDFTAGLASRRDLTITTLLLVLSLAVVLLAGAVLAQRTGSADLVRTLAGPRGLAIGNLLIALAVIAPTFTTVYSGAPALRAATGISQRTGTLLIAAVGLALGAAHFDQWLLPWLGILGAMLPPVVVPLAAEFASRRLGRPARRVPVWPWLAGAAVALALALAHHPLAMVAGFAGAGAATAVWQGRGDTVTR